MNSSLTEPSSRSWWLRGALLAVLALAAAAVAVAYRERAAEVWETLAESEQQLVAFHERHPLLMLAAVYLTYTAVTGASLPAATLMTMLLGWFFQRVYGPAAGLAVAVLVVSFAATSGATIAFLLSRYLFRDPLQRRYGRRLKKFNRALEREGAYYLLMLRILPAVPFFVLNLLMGLTTIRVRTYWWASQLGMLPGTLIYAYAGSRLPGPQEIIEKGPAGILDWQLFTALTLVALFPPAVKWLRQRYQPKAVFDDDKEAG